MARCRPLVGLSSSLVPALGAMSNAELDDTLRLSTLASHCSHALCLLLGPASHPGAGWPVTFVPSLALVDLVAVPPPPQLETGALLAGPGLGHMASTSGGAAVVKAEKPPTTSGVASTAPAGATSPALAVPHKGIVFLDKDRRGISVLTNIVTGERANLLPGTWHVEFSEESGFAALVKDEEPEVAIDVDTVLKRHLFEETATKERFVEQCGKISPFDAFLCRHRDLEVKIKLSSAQCWGDLDAWVMAADRSGKQRAFWSMGSVYKLFGMTTYKGCASKWTWRSAKSWDQAVQKELGIDSIIFSQHRNTTKSTTCPPTSDACPPSR